VLGLGLRCTLDARVCCSTFFAIVTGLGLGLALGLELGVGLGLGLGLG